MADQAVVPGAQPLHRPHLGQARGLEAGADDPRGLGLEPQTHLELLAEGRILLASLDWLRGLQVESV
mgnify:CR=1 FL=1